METHSWEKLGAASNYDDIQDDFGICSNTRLKENQQTWFNAPIDIYSIDHSVVDFQCEQVWLSTAIGSLFVLKDSVAIWCAVVVGRPVFLSGLGPTWKVRTQFLMAPSEPPMTLWVMERADN